MSRNINKTSQGFTIVELMLATTAFSVALLIAVGSFITIGQLFYKGLSNSQAQQIGRQTLNDIAGNIRRSPTVSTLQRSPTSGTSYYLYYCIGNNRYTYGHQSDKPIIYSGGDINTDVSSADANFGLVRDKLPGSDACAPPCPANHCYSFNNPQELLGSKMLVDDLKIECPKANDGVTCTSSSFYLIDLTVAYGDTSAMNFSGDPMHLSVDCQGNLSIQRFCGINNLSTGAYSGVHT